MTIRNTSLGGETNWATDEVVTSIDLNDTMSAVKTNLESTYGDMKLDGYRNAPIGTIVAWLKSKSGTPTIPIGWVECNGSNGTPNLNGTTDTNKYFLRGTSGTTGTFGGAATHNHVLESGNDGGNSNDYTYSPTSTSSHIPVYYEVVWIIKVGI